MNTNNTIVLSLMPFINASIKDTETKHKGEIGSFKLEAVLADVEATHERARAASDADMIPSFAEMKSAVVALVEATVAHYHNIGAFSAHVKMAA